MRTEKMNSANVRKATMDTTYLSLLTRLRLVVLHLVCDQDENLSSMLSVPNSHIQIASTP